MTTSITTAEQLAEAFKDNAIALAKHHREHCDGQCGINLWMLRELVILAGIKLTQEERGAFI